MSLAINSIAARREITLMMQNLPRRTGEDFRRGSVCYFARHGRYLRRNQSLRQTASVHRKRDLACCPKLIQDLSIDKCLDVSRYYLKLAPDWS